MNNLQIRARSIRSESGAVRFCVGLYDGDKLTTETTMTIADFVSLIEGAKKTTDIPAVYQIGEIPQGFVDGFKATTDKSTLGGIFYIPPQKHQFLLREAGKEKSYYLPMPGLIYSIAYVNGIRKNFNCFCYNGEWNGDETIVYRYPFGNVDSSGNICMGSIQVSQPKCFNDLREIIELSLNGVTGRDYLDGDQVVLTTKQTQMKFCDSIEHEEVFPHHLLIGSRMYGTVGEMRKSFLKKYCP